MRKRPSDAEATIIELDSTANEGGGMEVTTSILIPTQTQIPTTTTIINWQILREENLA